MGESIRKKWDATRLVDPRPSFRDCFRQGNKESTWVMMNQQTRQLSKMPKEARAEVAPWFIGKQEIQEDNPEKIIKLDDKATYVNSGLKVIEFTNCNLQNKAPPMKGVDKRFGTFSPREVTWMNHHVNKVKDVGWMLEGNGQLGSVSLMPLSYTHLLQLNGEAEKEEILRGRTTWKEKILSLPIPSS